MIDESLTSSLSGLNLTIVQSVVFPAPSSSAPSPSDSISAPPSQAVKAGSALGGVSGLEVLAHKRLEQTSTSLEAALKVVENKLAQGSTVDG